MCESWPKLAAAVFTELIKVDSKKRRDDKVKEWQADQKQTRDTMNALIEEDRARDHAQMRREAAAASGVRVRVHVDVNVS